MTIEALREEWTTLYRTTLPSLAKQHSSAQKKWPVYLDHCFARIILDNSVGEDQPWTKVLKSPAVKNVSSFI
jgi:methylated-DNA-[protein]-cysteine S-methyltransferase